MASVLDKETFFVKKDWSEASASTKGYEDSKLLEYYTLQMEKNHPDKKIDIYDPRHIELFCALQKCIEGKNSPLIVSDIGGGNGHLVSAAKFFIKNNITWKIFESKGIYEIYKQYNSDDMLWLDMKDYDDKQDVTLFSSSLQYLKNPRKILKKAIESSKYVILSRLPLIENVEDLITVQNVEINGHSYSWPAYFFGTKLISYIKRYTSIIYRWKTPTEQVLFQGNIVPLKGIFIAGLKKEAE